jgi:hypothetical protein
MVTLQVFPLVLSHPNQVANTEPELGVAVRVTLVPSDTAKEQVLPQLIPPPVTVPLPSPDFWTERVRSGPKVAVTALSWLMLTAQVLPLKLSHPDQLRTSEPTLGVAVSVTLPARLSEQSLPQSIPGPVTVPLPLPDRDTDSV